MSLTLLNFYSCLKKKALFSKNIQEYQKKRYELDIRCNHIKDDQLIELCNDLEHHKIINLFVGFNSITSVGLCVLVDFLLKQNCIEILDIGENNIGDSGLEKLSKLLVLSNNKVDALYLYKNGFGSKGISSLACSLNNPNNNLKGLNICSNNFGDEGLIELSKSLVHQNNKIIWLIMNNNGFGLPGLNALVSALIYHSSKVVHLDYGNQSATIFNVEGLILCSRLEFLSIHSEDQNTHFHISEVFKKKKRLRGVLALLSPARLLAKSALRKLPIELIRKLKHFLV